MSRPHDRRTPPWQRLVARFLGLFTVSMLLLVAVWPWIAPIYSRGIAEAMRIGFRWIEPAQVTVVESRGAELWIYRVIGPGQIRPYTWFDAYAFFALIPLLGLLAATPGIRLRRRLEKMAVGVAGLFLTQATYLVISVHLSYIAVGLTVTGPWLAGTLDVWQTLARLLWEAAPLAWWGGLTGSLWIRHLHTAHAEGKRCRIARRGMDARDVRLAREGRAS